MAYKVRVMYPDSTSYKVPGGNAVIAIVILFGIVTAACHLLAMADMLPLYG